MTTIPHVFKYLHFSEKSNCELPIFKKFLYQTWDYLINRLEVYLCAFSNLLSTPQKL